jgi:hypothetical protein
MTNDEWWMVDGRTLFAFIQQSINPVTRSSNLKAQLANGKES